MSRPLSSSAQIVAALVVASGFVIAAGTALAEWRPKPCGHPMKVWEWVLIAVMWLIAGIVISVDLLRRKEEERKQKEEERKRKEEEEARLKSSLQYPTIREDK